MQLSKKGTTMKVVPFFENLSPNQCYFKQSFSKIELTNFL